MLPSRAAIVATAGEAIARGSRSFAAASRLFDRRTRERAWLLYAWCRRCDDLADGQDHGHAAQPVVDAEARLTAIRERTQAALAGQWVGDAAFDSLRIVVTETGIPHEMVWDVVEGFAMDTAGWQPASEADLTRYCYHVAGAVGCMMAVVMGVSPDDGETLDRACDLGIAFQLGNISRDLAEDAANGRCYVPPEWGEDPRAELAKRAEAYAASGRSGTPALGFRSAWAVLAAAGIYGEIARKAAASGGVERVTTSAVEKAGWIARAFGQAQGRKRLFPAAKRDELWTRPRH